MDRHAVVAVVRDRGVRLNRQVQHLLGTESVLEYMRRGGESLVDIAAPQPEIQSDIGALAALEMLEVGERAGGLQLFMNESHVVGGLDLVEYSRKLFIFGG